MKTRTLFVFAFALSLAAFSYGQGAWKVFKPSGSVFSAKLPGTPKSQTQSFNVPGEGQINLTLYTLAGGGFFYELEDMVAQKAIGADETSTLLVSLQNGFMNTRGTTLVSGQNTTFKAYPARTMMFARGDKRIRALSVVAGNHVISFFAGGDGSAIKSANITGLFNSIVINGK